MSRCSNLDATGGLILAEAVMLALGESLGRLEAHRLVEEASHEALATGRTLRDVLGENVQVTQLLDASRLNALFDPSRYAGRAHAFVDAVLDASRGSQTHQES